MFAGSSESEPQKSLTLQLAPSWMEAWNIYPSIMIDHVPARATELVAYQRITTSASTQYPPTAWLNYNVQFRTLAALDPTYLTLAHMSYRLVASIYDSQTHTVNTPALYTLWHH